MPPQDLRKHDDKGNLRNKLKEKPPAKTMTVPIESIQLPMLQIICIQLPALRMTTLIALVVPHYSRTLQCYDPRKGGTFKSLCEKAFLRFNKISCFI